MEEDHCVICNDSLGSRDYATLTKKGCEGISEASNVRCQEFKVKPGEKVHTDCRKKFTAELYSPRKRKYEGKETCTTRNSGEHFEFKTHCLFCAKEIPKYLLTGKKSNNPVYPVRTIVLQESLRAKCIKRNDDWGKEVLSRIDSS